MWIVENDGDALQGKKLWLRPGKKFLFGRTADNGPESGFVIVDKTISRKHLTLEVDPVQPSDCANPRSRSRVTLTDLNTKIGTLVNGEQIRGKAHILEQDNNTIGLGKYKHHFRITWVPVTLTFSFTSKEQKADPYTELYAQLGPLDIKLLIDFDPVNTTHLVAKKRNTSKGLQALISGRYIVHNDTFVKALIAAATSSGTSPALLEEDFGNFPDPLQYLPPKGEEPTQRNSEAYEPNPDRRNMFDGYTFIFYERKQFENLLAPITDGHGKALLREAVPNQTTVEDFVRYVKGVAGEKGLGEFEDGSEGKGVVVVKYNVVKGAGVEWFGEFGTNVALYLDHRLIEQNEFLDAILGNNASVLRRPLEPESSDVIPPPPTAAIASESQTLRSSHLAPAPTLAESAPTEPARRGRSRRAAAPRFKGFDDEDFGLPANINSIPEAMAVENTPAVEPQSQSLFLSQDPDTNMDQEVSRPSSMQPRTGRKRSATPFDEDEEEIAPAAAALKRRRLEEVARGGRGLTIPPPPKAKPAPKKKAHKEIDVLEELQEARGRRAEALDEAEREASPEAISAADIEALRDLAIIEEMEVKRSYPPPQQAALADESDRWDDKWNGRKNFKKFRRRGTANTNMRDFNRVIVPLEEVKKKDFGIGDDYWLDGDGDRESQRNKKKGKGRENQDTSQLQGRSRHRGAPERAADILASEAEEDISRAKAVLEAEMIPSSDVEIVEEPLRAAAISRTARSQTLVDKTNKSQNLPTQGLGKRAAATTLTKPAPVKKPRQTLIKRRQESDDSEDELKFKFTKRK